MNVYDYLDLLSVAIRDNSAVQSYCVSNFGKGLLVAIDDDAEAPIGSEQAPYCLLMSTEGATEAAISEDVIANIRVEVGTVAQGEPPYVTETTARTASANGLIKYGQGEKAADLLTLIITAMKAVNFSDCAILTEVSFDVSGALLFPLALAVSSMTINKYNELSTF